LWDQWGGVGDLLSCGRRNVNGRSTTFQDAISMLSLRMEMVSSARNSLASMGILRGRSGRNLGCYLSIKNLMLPSLGCAQEISIKLWINGQIPNSIGGLPALRTGVYRTQIYME
jgi:hypothetical protein